MISEGELRGAIAECLGQRNPNADTCKKLASYYIILDKLSKETPQYSYAAEQTGQIQYDSGSEFAAVIRGCDYVQVIEIMDELMDCLQALAPKLYSATMAKLRAL